MSKYFFTDSEGVKREISINFYTLFNVFSVTHYDLLNPDAKIDDVMLSDKLLNEPMTLLKVVYALCAKDETQEEFYAKITPESFIEVENAFWNSYADFFVRFGAEWVAIAIRDRLKKRIERVKKAEATPLDSQNETSSN